jgi:hypothetical protein
MCVVTQEQLERWEAEYEADVTDLYMSDTEAFTKAVRKLGFVHLANDRLEKIERLNEELRRLEDLACNPRIFINEKGPTSSEAEPNCGLCEKPYSACRCIPF